MEFYGLDTGWGCGGIIVYKNTILITPPIFKSFIGSPINVLKKYKVIVMAEKWIPPKKRCWNCFSTDMQPTDYTLGVCRQFKCAECGARLLWVDEPDENETHAKAHYSKQLGGHSSMSMLSDPECNVFGPAKYPPPPGPDGPFRMRIDKKSYRWHRGREEWVLWE